MIDVHPATRLYFAYGSNLALAQMQSRCPQAQPVAAYTLPGYRLAYVGERSGRWGRGGVATIVPDAVASVPGALYRLTPEDEALLDGFEGVASGAYYKDTTAITYHGEHVLVYIASARLGAENQPNAKYLEVIRKGYHDWELPAEALVGIEVYPADEA